MVPVRRHARDWRAYLTGGGLVLGALACGGAQTPPHHPQLKPPAPSGRNTQTQEHQVSAKPQASTQGQKDQPLPVATAETTPDHQTNPCKSDEKGDRDSSKNWWSIPDWWVAGFTGILTFATIVLGVFTALLWRETRNAVKDAARGTRIADETYIAAHRPLIVVRSLFMLPPKMGNKARMLFDIYNKGDTRACITSFSFYVVFSSDEEVLLPIVRTENPLLPTNIEPGETIKWAGCVNINENKFMNYFHAAIWSVERPKASMEFRGIVKYEDIMLRKRQSSFHRAYDFKARRFCLIENSEFEYTD